MQFEARLELFQDLDKVSRKIPFGQRELLPEFRDTVDEVLAGVRDGTIPATVNRRDGSEETSEAEGTTVCPFFSK